jgi:hypothetical protein
MGIAPSSERQSFGLNTLNPSSSGEEELLMLYDTTVVPMRGSAAARDIMSAVTGFIGPSYLSIVHET